MPTTSNFGWTTPADTDLVKDGAAAIRTLGNGIDTSFLDLKGGTTGQVLSKASNTDLDFTWTAASASPINKNYLINGSFAIAQRGTSFTASNNNDDAYTLDRWYILSDTNDVIDVTQDTTTVPTNGQFAIALDVETVNKKFGIATIIENKDVIGLVGNTVTFSFKAKVSSTTKLDNVKAAIVAWSGTADSVTSDIISAWNVEGTNPTLIANATYENSPVNLNLTTSYATYSVSAAVDTASTKNLILFVWSDVTDTTLGDFLYIAEAKLELGSSATAFEYAGGTIAGELAACQRYYWRLAGGAAANYAAVVGVGYTLSANTCNYTMMVPVPMRTAAISIDYADMGVQDQNDTTITNLDSITLSTHSSNYGTSITITKTGGFTDDRVIRLVRGNNAAGYIGVSAEL